MFRHLRRIMGSPEVDQAPRWEWQSRPISNQFPPVVHVGAGGRTGALIG
jgi:hypothetical protein